MAGATRERERDLELLIPVAGGGGGGGGVGIIADNGASNSKSSSPSSSPAALISSSHHHSGREVSFFFSIFFSIMVQNQHGSLILMGMQEKYCRIFFFLWWIGIAGSVLIKEHHFLYYCVSDRWSWFGGFCVFN